MIRLSLVAIAVGLAAGAVIAGAVLEHQSHTYPRPHRRPMRVLPSGTGKGDYLLTDGDLHIYDPCLACGGTGAKGRLP